MREKQRNAHFPRAAMETTTARLENSRTDYQVVMVHTHTHTRALSNWQGTFSVTTPSPHSSSTRQREAFIQNVLPGNC